MLTIGSEVKFVDEYAVTHKGKLTEVLSDAHDDVVLNEGVVEYWSKKTKSYRPVKEKDMETVYIEIEGRNYNDFILLGDIINES